jgi:hypothetical protein
MKTNPVDHDNRYVEVLREWDSAHYVAKNRAAAIVRNSGVYVYVGGRHYGERSREVYVRNDSGLVQGIDYSREEAAPHILSLEQCLQENLADPWLVADYEAAVEKENRLLAVILDMESIYARDPWNRYWLVVSSDGHIHRSCNCSTCNKGKEPTKFALVPSLSGSADDAAVEKLGPALCSVCFPDAPVESKEQAKIPGRLALVLAEKGEAEFDKASKVAAEKAAKRAAVQCPGSGQQGKSDRYGFRVICPCCGYSARMAGSSLKVRKHAGKGGG